ncbi:bud emergence protein 1 [Lunasporangiospora selenospora]|uniref:Bud emergence protein 1 n=1 Tax=Lunasporangiospora selenospora TaxID=979761 RepID=A0A9P6KEF0_9FUNG|nr:bud emergence protein 1 [Lunasporangiospora selenospora]
MPIPLQTVDDKVSASRRSDLDGYVQELCRLPAKITQHPFVLELLSVKDGDMETLPGPGSSTPAPSKAEFYGEPTDRRPSTAMGTSRPHGNGATAGGGPGTGGGAFHKYKDETRSIDGSSPSTRSQATFSNPNTMSIPPLGNNNVNGSGANEMARGASGGGGGGESNGIHQASVAGNGAGSKAEDMIKVKISYEDDIMAIRIPVTITFRALQQKIFERLLCSHKELSYRDDRGDFASIQDNNDVRDAIDRSGGKLMIYVD